MSQHEHRPTVLTYSRPFPWLRRVWHLHCPGCPEDYVEDFPSRESAEAVREWDSFTRRLELSYPRNPEIDAEILDALGQMERRPTGTGWPE